MVHQPPTGPAFALNQPSDAIPPDPEILARNLAAIRVRDPGLADRLLAQTPHPGAIFRAASDGAVTGEISELGRSRSLASKRRPLAEAETFAGAIDLDENGAVVVLGFALGHHAAALAERTADHSVLIIFEPDLGLLRAVFERIDHSSWISKSLFVFATDPNSPAEITSKLSGLEGIVSIGLHIAEHLPSKARLAAESDAFVSSVTRAVRATRTALTTTLVQVEPTLRNLLMNLDRYTTCGGIAALAGSRAGKPAVVVSAGPSMRASIEELAKPGVRDRVTIVAVQTALKPLLEAGVKPHYVTALDHHEISVRFYENLTEKDVEGVTLVCEPKANPAILDAFPGEIRLAADEKLDMLLGEKLMRDMGPIEPGATVAHLAYLLARHLGCDPVILVGQDLAFTGNLYYGDGAAIHNVWACELSEFRTLEMLEWERIARGKHLLSKVEGVDGNAVYTDEQMNAYLTQFERMFASDAQRGLSTIDASGGARKRDTTAMSLGQAVETSPSGALTDALQTGSDPKPVARASLKDRLRRLRLDARSMARKSRETAELLSSMQNAAGDQTRITPLIERMNKIRDEVQELRPVFELTQYLSQTAALNRFKADRDIRRQTGLSPAQAQAKQIDRDLQNVRWLADAADHLAEMLSAASDALSGAPKVTRDVDKSETRDSSSNTERHVAAFIRVDPDTSSLGVARDLSAQLACGRNALEITLERLASTEHVRRVILVTEHPERVQKLLTNAPASLDILVVHDDEPKCDRCRFVSTARLVSPDTWRGGIAGLTVYDELLDPRRDIEILEDERVTHAVLLGADWCCIDPRLVDECVERSAERDGQHRFVFTQAAPGFAPAVIESALVRELASGPIESPFSSIAGLLGYVPQHPRSDPIARTDCVQVPIELRDAHARAIPDAPHKRSVLARMLEEDTALPSVEIARRLTRVSRTGSAPRSLTIELCTGRAIAPRRAEPAERQPMSLVLAKALIAEFAELRPDGVLSLGGAGDPLRSPDLAEIIGFARDQGVASIQVTTDLLEDTEVIDSLIDSGPDIISVHVHAGSPAAYASITGADRLAEVMQNLAYVSDRLSRESGTPSAWLVPRLTRCDATIHELEGAYDHFLTCLGVCVIDPPREAQRVVAPLTLPHAARRRIDNTRLTILSDGSVVSSSRRVATYERRGDLQAAWRAATHLHRTSGTIIEPRFSEIAVGRAAS